MTGFRHGEVLSSSAADYAYLMLRDGIEVGRFAPGRRMREVELAEWLGVSRTPVRQALARLQAEGILAVAPRQGLVVQSFDIAGIRELYDVRIALEGMAARLAAASASRDEVARIAALLDGERRLPCEARALVRHNRAFHAAICQAAHNRFLARAMQPVTDALDLLGFSTLSMPGRQASALAEHEAIVAAIGARDPPGAEAAARAHIRAGLGARLAMLEAQHEAASRG